MASSSRRPTTAFTESKLDEAEDAYSEVLAIDPRQPHAIHNLGTLLFRKKQPRAACILYMTAVDLMPDNEAFLASYVNALARTKQYGEALRVLHERRGRVAKSERLTKLEAVVKDSGAKRLPVRNPGAAPDSAFLTLQKKFRKQDYLQTIEATRKLLADRPAALLGWRILALALMEQGSPYEASACYRRMLASNPKSEVHTVALGRALALAGRTKGAIATLKRYADRFGINRTLLLEIVDLLVRSDQGDLALQFLDETEIAPEDEAIALCLRGSAYNRIGRHEEAEKAYLTALDVAPEDPTIYANALNYFSETTNDEIIADLIERAKAVGVSFDNPVMTLLAGRTELRNQNFEEAHAYLLRHYNKHEHTHLMLQRAFAIGNACDKLGKPAEAWEAFSFGNMIRDKLERNARKYSREAYKIRINAGRKYIDKYRDDPDFRAQFETDPDHENMCFVLSFPRSGTTLLDNILRSHPKIEAFEEKPIVVETMKRVAESMGAGMMMTQYDDIMDRIFATEGPELRRIYMSMLETFRDEKSDETAAFADKVPLNTIYLPQILKMFPKATIVFALRHPCDTLLSCYMQNFRANDSNLFFTSMEHSVWLYDTVMELWTSVVETFGIDPVIVRYEELVEDLEGQVRR